MIQIVQTELAYSSVGELIGNRMWGVSRRYREKVSQIDDMTEDEKRVGSERAEER